MGDQTTDEIEAGASKTITKDNVKLLLPTSTDLKYYGPGEIMNTLWWILFVFNILTYVVVIIKIGNVIFTNFLFTYDLPTSAPGNLLTTRFSFYFWFIIVSIMFEISILILAGIRVAMPWNQTYSIMHTIVAVITVVVEFATAIAMLVVGNNANTLSDPTNPARSELFCAANSHPNNPALTPVGCPTPTVAYSIVVSPNSLNWGSVFTINFGLTWTLVLFTSIQLAVAVVMSTRFKTIFTHVKVWTDNSNMYKQEEPTITEITVSEIQPAEDVQAVPPEAPANSVQITGKTIQLGKNINQTKTRIPNILPAINRSKVTIGRSTLFKAKTTKQ